MPGFPDKFSPFYKTPPGSAFSSNASRTLGFGMRRLRGVTNRSRDREPRWDSVDQGAVPTGWAKVGDQGAIEKAMGYIYDKVQFYGVRKPGRYDKRRWGTDTPQRPMRPSPRHEDEDVPEE
jgi:hydrogenase small subunit